MSLFDSFRDAIAAFPGNSVSDRNVALNTWNTTRESEYTGKREDTVDKARTDQTPERPDKGENTDLGTMVLDTINLDEVGMDEGLNIYGNMWDAYASDHSIDIPQAFRVGLFLEAISRS